ncbi:MAG: T9SS type A sorting domain-containing protein, partial [Bacteroidia bacterium]
SGTYSAYSHFTTTSGGGCGIPGSLTATSITATSATLSWGAVSGATTYTLQYRVSGGALTTVGNLATTSKALSGLSANTVYDYHVKAVCSGTSGTYSAYSHFTTTTGGTGCVTPDPYEPNGGKAAAKPIAVNTLIYAVINNATDKDWYSFTTTTAAPKIKIVLNTLPFDYDVKLFNTAGTQIAISDNSGTTAETIIYNAATTGATYYVQVYGYSGVYNATSCYHLKVNTRATNYRLDDAIVADVEHTGDISLYPNPANDQLTISLTSDANQTSRISIIDMLGHTALSTESELSEGDNKVDIDLSALQNGVYFVQVICNGEKTIQKLVIQK